MAEPLLQGLSLQSSLTVKELEKSAKWYTEVLGFTVSRKIERDGKLRGYALEAGQVRIILNQDDGAKGWDRVKGAGMSYQITVSQDVDALAARATAHGATLETPVTDAPWGARFFRVRDPDGFRWSISRPTQG